MILKPRSGRSSDIERLQSLIPRADDTQASKIQAEIRRIRAGEQGEKDAAYYLDFHFGEAKNSIVIHDLRIEVGRLVAQIDHLLLTRGLEFYVLETKHFAYGIKIQENGEFEYFDGKHYRGMASPIEQVNRHIDALNRVLDTITLPKRLGIALRPKLTGLVLVAPNARVIRPKSFDTACVVKADQVAERICNEETNFLQDVCTAARLVSRETLMDLARQIVDRDRPIAFDWEARFGIASRPASVARTNADTVVCKHCGGADTEAKHGRYGPYLRCRACGGNTALRKAA